MIEDSAGIRERSMKSNIKIVVVGNCQARPLAKILESLNPKINVTAMAIVHLLKDKQFEEYRPAFDEADLIVSQLVFDAYPCEFVRTNFLIKHYGSKVISIVNLYFSGYTPDWFCPRIPGVGVLKGPMGDYHNRTILEAWCSGEAAEIACSKLTDKKHNQKYVLQIERSFNELLDREKDVDVPITDAILSRYRKERLFFTFNHPSMVLIREYAERILGQAGISNKRSLRSLFKVKDRELLNQLIPLANPANGLPAGQEVKHKGVDFVFDEDHIVKTGRKKYYDSRAIVEKFYLIYEKYGDELNLTSLYYNAN